MFWMLDDYLWLIQYFFGYIIYKIGGGGGFLLFQMKPETLDLSYKTDLDFLDCFRRVN